MKHETMKRLATLPVSMAAFMVIGMCLQVNPAFAQSGNHFEERVRPLLVTRCAPCHQKSNAAAGIDFSTSAGIRKYIASKAIRSSSDAGARALINRITTVSEELRMPPTGERLSKADVNSIQKWLDGGAKVPDAGRTGNDTLWSLQALKVRKGDSIDGIISRARAIRGLTASRPADKLTLLRRIHFDLTGLPPSAATIATYQSDLSGNAYRKMADRLLASKGYGEQQARYWLDVVHFGETHGFDKDKRRDDAYLYKHWVISAFNADLPVDTFVQHQLAGDVITPEDRSAVIATGFLAAGPWDFVGQVELPEGVVEKAKTRNLDRDDILTSTMQTFTGLSVQCARCHDHKFDPIPQRDYYSLQAVFAGIERASRPLPTTSGATANAGPSPTNGWHSDIETAPDVSHWVQVDYAAPVTGNALRITPARPTDFQDTPGFGFPQRFRIDVIYADGTAGALLDATGKDFQNPGSQPLLLAINKPIKTARITATKLWKRSNDYVFALAEVEVMAKDQRVAATAAVTSSSSIEQGRWGRLALVDGFDSRGTVVPTVYGVLPVMPRPVYLLSRGEVTAPLDVIQPKGLSCINGVKFADADWSKEGNRRLALAKWITSPDNPLLWRTLANRIWITHFGQGLVETPNDFGWNGSRPAVPELLDFLASELRRTRSIKHIHRLIIMSETYQQASFANAANEAKDKGNRYYWRFTPRRLHAEEIRDAVLASAGKLRGSTQEQISFDLFGFRDDHSPEYRVDDVTPWLDERNFRRSIYRFMVRSVPIPFFEVFDAPDPSVSVPLRTTSITPLQALTLSNHPFMRHMAMAAPVADQVRGIKQMFLSTLGRYPSKDELLLTQKYAFDYGSSNTWLAMWNSNAFLTLR
jgi:cytochrome c553